MKHLRVTAAVCVLLAATGTHVFAQERAEIIRGKVVTDSGRLVVGADVLVTRAPDRMLFQTTTDSSGNYRLIIPEGTGDYLVHISALGRTTFRKRALRSPSDSAVTVDAVLKAGAQQLVAVQVQGQKPKPTRDAPFGAEVGASEKVADGVNGAVPPDLAGDITAIASTIPGVTALPNGGFSVLGLGAQQNSTTLGGMAFSGTALPRGVRMRTRVSTSTLDPARGWFSGAQVNVELASGTLFTARHLSLTADVPQLQAEDMTSSGFGNRLANLQASLGGEGPTTESDTYFYSYGLQASHHNAGVASLLDARPLVLQHLGLSPDSAARVLSLLEGRGIPLGAEGVPAYTTSDAISFVARFDHAPYDWKTFSPSRRTWGLTTFESWKHSAAVGLAPSVTPASTGSSTDWTVGTQAMYSTYFGRDWLNDTRSSFFVTDEQTQPYLRFPTVRLLVASAFSDAPPAITTLESGGNSTLGYSQRQWTWETTSETQFYAFSPAAHRLKLNVDSRLDGVREASSANRYGTFFYNSLSDFEGDQPASFTREIDPTAASGGEWNGFISLGDVWRASPKLQLTYGARLEGNVFTAAPPLNPLIRTVFGVRTDNTPNTIHLSPRLGFTWIRRSGDDGIRFSPLGQFNLGAVSYLRGGIGEFRSMLPPSLLANATANLGFVGGRTNLTCIGQVVPAPDWPGYLSNPESVPTQCAGTQTSPLGDSGTAVQFLDREYTAPRSWRANLAYSSSYRRLSYSIEGIYSLNLNQSGWTDVNFLDAARFTLPAEGGRPIFVDTSDIVASSGLVSPVGARRSASFGRVINNQSIDRSAGKKLTLTLSPDLSGLNNWLLAGSYTLSSVRALSNGFDGSTAVSPTTREWGRGNFDWRHRFLVQAGYAVHGLAMTIFGTLASGTPFTPMVGTDINGDGLQNDRAFIFRPDATTDTSLATAIRTLSNNASREVRKCLTRQFGHIAAINGCEGPWTANLNAQITASPELLHSGRLSRVALFLTNPLGGLDQILHGSNRLRGWGAPAIPDPVLYNVRGFDQSAGEFKYAVNPRFGDTRPLNTIFRAPFRITLDVSVNLGRSVAEQQLDRSLRPGRNGHPGPRMTLDELKRRYARTVANPYSEILQQSDSLLLTNNQVMALQEVDSRYRARVDTVWSQLAAYLDSLGDRYNASEALTRQEAAVDEVWEISRVDVRQKLREILSPIQLKLLPGWAGVLFKMNTPTHAPRNTF
ncbi:MAG TPA: hypothetical protein DHU55_15100 [Blastocatellia bacterium]|nr:hypothetical protein [Blastocatellia bacterium]